MFRNVILRIDRNEEKGLAFEKGIMVFGAGPLRSVKSELGRISCSVPGFGHLSYWRTMVSRSFLPKVNNNPPKIFRRSCDVERFTFFFSFFVTLSRILSWDHVTWCHFEVATLRSYRRIFEPPLRFYLACILLISDIFIFPIMIVKSHY